MSVFVVVILSFEKRKIDLFRLKSYFKQIIDSRDSNRKWLFGIMTLKKHRLLKSEMKIYLQRINNAVNHKR